jgi:hypothetical protein
VTLSGESVLGKSPDKVTHWGFLFVWYWHALAPIAYLDARIDYSIQKINN